MRRGPRPSRYTTVAPRVFLGRSATWRPPGSFVRVVRDSTAALALRGLDDLERGEPRAHVDGERVHVFGRPQLFEARGDFRLRADSAGYKAAKDGKDLGADVDLVGPGSAYERWKKTPEYQQWLKDTAHVKK